MTTALGYMLGWLAAVPPLAVPLYIVGVMLLISTPSMILAAMKLRQRNLGPILDANGWAVNAKAKLNIPFGGSLTHTPKLPPGSSRDTVDPYAESHHVRNRTILALILIAIIGGLWYFGILERAVPNWLPLSPYMQRVRDQEAKDAAKAAAASQAAASQAATKAASLPSTPPESAPATAK
ncbi:MAG TPA: hypothetical protein VHM90_22505 [Phycisphaerae bacterium]|nr:hypothetical protein [Phycisphaerae bacterium]